MSALILPSLLESILDTIDLWLTDAGCPLTDAQAAVFTEAHVAVRDASEVPA